MRRTAHVKAWSAWAPGVVCAEEWKQWAAGGRGIQAGDAAPALAHLPALFKRRLSQLSRMVLHVGHELSPGPAGPKTVFASTYGEIGQQLKLTASMIEAGEIPPAAFSLSVFNAPVALLSIAEKNPQRGIALNAGAASFETGLLEAFAVMAHSGDPEVLLIAADEALPAPLHELAAPGSVPHALGLLLAGAPSAGSSRLALEACAAIPGQAAPGETPAGDEIPSALRFLRWFLGERLEPLRLEQAGCRLTIE